MSGDTTRRRTGVLQIGLGLFLFPLLGLVTFGYGLFAGIDPETIKAWLANFVIILVIWNIFTGVQIFREAWREASRKSKEQPRGT
jgi:hypothetical protein